MEPVSNNAPTSAVSCGASDHSSQPKRRRLITTTSITTTLTPTQTSAGLTAYNLAVPVSAVPQTPHYDYVMSVSLQCGFSNRAVQTTDKWWVVGSSLAPTYELQHVDTGVRSEAVINDSFLPIMCTGADTPFRVCIVGTGANRQYEICVDSVQLKNCIVNGKTIAYESCLIDQFTSFSTTKHYQLRPSTYGVKLLEATPAFRKTHVSSKLYPEQLASLEWMLDYENSVRSGACQIVTNNFARLGNSGYSITSTSPMIVNNDCAQPRVQTPRLGILSNATGSGKTAIVINMIKFTVKERLTPPPVAPATFVDGGGSGDSPQQCQEWWTDAEAGRMRVSSGMTTRRSGATLIIVPMNLPKQWMDEFVKFYPDANVHKLTNKREHELLTYQTLIDADCVVTTMAFLCGTGYKKNMETAFGNITINSPVFHLTARRIVNHATFPQTHSPVLQLIWWRRIVFDEAHEIMTSPTTSVRMLNWTLFNLDANIKWALTGTPNMGSLGCRDFYTKLALDTVTGLSAPSPSFPLFDQLLRTCYHQNDVTQRRADVRTHEYRVRLTPQEYRLINSYRVQNPIDIVQLATTYNVLDPAFVEDVDHGGVGCDAGAAADSGSGAIKLLTLVEIEQHVQLARTRDIVRLQHEQVASQLQHDTTTHALHEAERQLVQNTDNLRITALIAILRVRQVRQGEALTIHKQNLGRAETEYQFFHKQLHNSGNVNVDVNAGCAGTMSTTTSTENGDITMAANQTECPICMVTPPHVITRCGHWYCKECASKMVLTSSKCALCKRKLTLRDLLELNSATQSQPQTELTSSLTPAIAEVVPEIVPVTPHGTKMAAIIAKINEITAEHGKIVMFVQWNRLMRSIKTVLQLAGVHASCMDGNTHARANALAQFQTGSSAVLLISIENGAAGLNLIEANHVIFTHALLSHSNEELRSMYAQAVGRVNRMGQTQSTIHVHWFISRDTVEESLFTALATS